MLLLFRLIFDDAMPTIAATLSLDFYFIRYLLLLCRDAPLRFRADADTPADTRQRHMPLMPRLLCCRQLLRYTPICRRLMLTLLP